MALNTETLELSFKNNASLKPTIETVKTIRPEQFAYREGPHHNSLADAVKPFTGKSYENIDCYGLVVRGLINQGIKYHGHGGLREKLEDLAELNSLPGKVNERVGEEFLKAEIKNWFTLAANRKESLKVTLGQVHTSQAQDFVMSGFPSLEKRG